MTSVLFDNETLTMQVADNIRLFLARRHVSGLELTRRLGEGPSWLSVRVTGKVSPTLGDLERIALALNASVTDLLGGTASPDLPESVRAIVDTLKDRSYNQEDRQALLNTMVSLHTMFIRTVPKGT